MLQEWWHSSARMNYSFARTQAEFNPVGSVEDPGVIGYFDHPWQEAEEPFIAGANAIRGNVVTACQDSSGNPGHVQFRISGHYHNQGDLITGISESLEIDETAGVG